MSNCRRVFNKEVFMRSPTAVLVLPACIALASSAALADSTFSVSAGFDYSTGTYGSSSDTRIWYYPLMAKYEADALTLKLTVPYLKITGPSNVVAVGGQPIQVGATGATRTESGLGDVIGAASYSLLDNRASGLPIALTAKITFATADDAKGLGTGENDYALQSEVTKILGQHSVFGTLGRKKYGDPPGVDFQDPWYISLGAAYKASPAMTAGLSYDFRERVLASSSEVSEVTAFVSYKVTSTTKLQTYLVKGFSDGSPDWGAGIVLGASF